MDNLIELCGLSALRTPPLAEKTRSFRPSREFQSAGKLNRKMVLRDSSRRAEGFTHGLGKDEGQAAIVRA